MCDTEWRWRDVCVSKWAQNAIKTIPISKHGKSVNLTESNGMEWSK